MRNTFLIATLSLIAFAWAQAADSSCCAGQDFYNQTVAAQAQQNSFAEAAIAQSASVSAESENWNEPGSIASNSGDDFYASTVASQAKLNSLIMAATTPSAAEEQNAMPAEQETSSVADPESMASDEAQSADADFYGQKVSEQADLNNRLLEANRLEALSPTAPELSSDEPGSMAANEGSQGTDFYGQTVAIQANANRLLQDANGL
jgi:hypothetical protein